jgi:hypothetical protein
MSHCDPAKQVQSHSRTSFFNLHLHHPHFKVSQISVTFKLIIYIAGTDNGGVYRKVGIYIKILIIDK